jgi:hypothetical protein
MRRYIWQLACLVCTALSVGCSSARRTVGIQGEVNFDDRRIERGRIDFVPVEGTPGPSAVASIVNGRYDVPARWGLLPDGVYLVRITAFRKTGKMEPNRIDRHGPPVEVEENFIPAIYSNQSTMKVRVAGMPDKSNVDFHLRKVLDNGPRAMIQ